MYRGTGREQMWYKAAGTAKGQPESSSGHDILGREWREAGMGLGVGRWAGFIPEATGNARWAWEERGHVEMCVSGGSLAAGGRGREERQLAGEMGRPSGELRAGPAEGGGCPGAGRKGSWSGRRGFERL